MRSFRIGRQYVRSAGSRTGSKKSLEPIEIIGQLGTSGLIEPGNEKVEVVVISRTLAAVAAASLIFGTSAAAAQSAAPTSAPAVERAGADVADASELRGTTGWIIGAIALALLVWGAIELFDDNEDSESP